MKGIHKGAIVGITAVALASTMAGPAQATAGAPAEQDVSSSKTHKQDNLPNPLAEAQAKLTREAVAALASGKATLEVRGGERVIKMGGNSASSRTSAKASKPRYVRYPVTREESILTILAEFGDQIDSRTGGTAGPMHNEIAKPDRNWDGNATDDNTTYWQADFNRDHFMNLMFGDGLSFKDFYDKQSNGRFLAKGDVSDWVKLPFNASRYGSNALSDSEVYWPFIEDTAQAWFDAQKASGMSDAEVADYVKGFDKVDRYDYDGDGVYLEPDGYIDHFQAIHAGEGEEAGGGAQGDDAIWSHRWYVNSTDYGTTGPAMNRAGGTQIGNTGIWIGDYTTEPENGGLGVFAHEFGHDLGLDDYYDTAGGDNSTAFWTLMSGGSWMNYGGNAIGTVPTYMGPHEKLLLGWLDFKVIPYGQSQTVNLGPSAKDAQHLPQALLVQLPEKTVTTEYTTPHSGSMQWWGGSADSLQNTMSRPIDLTGATSANVGAWVWANIEADYDFMYAEVSTDGGANWTPVGDSLSGDFRSWTQYSWDLSAYAGQKIDFRFRYATDGGLHYEGPFVDDISVVVDGSTVFSDDVEGGDNGWTAKGFTRMDGTTTVKAAHYYLAENRNFMGYDRTLAKGPYNFGWASTKPNWVEHFPYQDGLLVWYIDDTYSDNNTSAHPGGGMALPVDARAKPITFPDGALLGNRRQPFDATFGLHPTDAVTFHRNGVPVEVPSQRALPTFNDSDPMRYWSALNPLGSVKVAGTGTKIRVNSESWMGARLSVTVTF